jgi:hypothetical protein
MRAGGGTSPFSPASLFASGEEGVWYDIAPAYCFTDTSRTTNAAVGDAVAAVEDRSGNGNHATQTTAAARPILRQTGGGLYYLEFDGVDDVMVTPTITPGTDKVQVFAGVTKASDATTAAIVEFGSNSSTNSSSFGIFNRRLSAGDYGSHVYGNARNERATPTSFAAPISNVVACLYDIAEATAELENRVRVDGANQTLTGIVSGPAGTGNFLAYPLYIGARAGTSLFFNGRIYSLITRFGANLDTAVIEQTEGYVAGKTGVTLA